MSKYSEATRLECIQKRLEGRTIESITKEYGLGKGTLKYWLDQYNKEATPQKKIEDAEHKRLLKVIAEQEKELTFLKEAASYFASHPKK